MPNLECMETSAKETAVLQANVFYFWLREVYSAANGVTDASLLPRERRRKEKELALLTTPAACLDAVAFIDKWFPRSMFDSFYGDKA